MSQQAAIQSAAERRREIRQEIGLRWRENHPGKSTVQSRAWQAANPLRFKLAIAVRMARRRGRQPVSIDMDYVNSLPEVIAEKCALSGLAFSYGAYSPFSPSLDRIDNELGYVPGNVRVVLTAINSLKGVGTDEDMWRIVEALHANSR